jgi:hypothetical protein
MHRHLLAELFYPPDVLAPEGASKIPSPKTADDINDLFSELDNEEESKSEKKIIKTKEVDDEDEIHAEEGDEGDDLELIEPDEEIEKLDLAKPDDDIDIQAPPRMKEISKKYPELFKDFPFLAKMMSRDRQYNELFGSFDDAKEVAEKSETFNSFESQLLSGNTEEVLRSVKDADDKAFNIIVDDYLPTLAKVDKEAYFHVVGNLNKRLIMEMVQEANDTNNDDLKQAALLVNQFIFGSAKFTPPSNRVDRSKENSTEKNEAESERISFLRERYESSRDDLQSQVDNTLRATITDYIDPKGNMSSYVKKNAVADAMKILTSSISKDPTVIKSLDKLWRAATDNKFSKDSLGRIKSFYLSKAKGNLKNAILKARSEALKDSRPANKDKDTEDFEEESTPRVARKTISAGKPSQPKSKNGMQKGESVTDFFMRD